MAFAGSESDQVTVREVGEFKPPRASLGAVLHHSFKVSQRPALTHYRVLQSGAVTFVTSSDWVWKFVVLTHCIGAAVAQK